MYEIWIFFRYGYICLEIYRCIMVTKCMISENAVDYLSVIIGAIGITASLYNYYSQFKVPQSQRDVQLLASLGTTAMIGYITTTLLESARLSTCNIPID